jgi:threonine dehydratase
MNFNRLRFVAERAELGEKREALLAVTIPEKPGAFMQLYSLLHPRNVTEFSYRYVDSKEAHIYLSFEVRDRAEVSDVVKSLCDHDFIAIDISGNEMAKDHTRYLAGGRSTAVKNERIFRFTFPERPGALLRFLSCLAGERSSSSTVNSSPARQLNTLPPFNVSLFHYRNYASDTGKVLAGIQVPSDQTEEFQFFLDSLGYPYAEETNNPVYKQFLL